MNYNELDATQDKIRLLLIKKKKIEMIMKYLKCVKPAHWKKRMKELTCDMYQLDDTLSLAYAELDDLFNNKS